jgi:hypothetical protein
VAGQRPYANIEKDPAFLQGVATQDPATIDALLKAFGRSWVLKAGSAAGVRTAVRTKRPETLETDGK